LKADARNVVGIIGGDKAKTQAYCQIALVGEQMNQAVQAKDKKKLEELAQKLSELEKSLGPEYLGLVESLGKVNLPPKDGQEIVSTFETLDASCPIKQLSYKHRRRNAGSTSSSRAGRMIDRPRRREAAFRPQMRATNLRVRCSGWCP
jgi:hypothetical protein